MNNYTNYGIEDFVQDLYFRKWALDQLPSEDHFWDTWLAKHPEQQPIIEQAKTLVIAFQHDDLPVNQEEINQNKALILAATLNAYPLPVYRKPWFLLAAASLLLLVGFYFMKPTSLSLEKEGLTAFETPAFSNLVETNSETVPKTIQLTDGTAVTLSPNSTLRINQNFGQRLREVYLTGEAFFDVAKDAQKPFYVYSGSLVTKVLGTSFLIKAHEKAEEVSVSVKSGKVTVFKNEKTAKTAFSEEMILTPNQQAVYLKDDERLVKTLVKSPLPLSPKSSSRSFEFNETPVPQVFIQLENEYGIKITFDEDALKKCALTASLTTEPLFDKLNLICETIQARYEVADGQIIIYGKGCP